MKRFIILSMVILSTAVIYSVLTLSIPLKYTWASDAPQRVDIESAPSDILFNLSNMGPGNSEEQVLVIKNNGNLDFNYNVMVEFDSGSELFYNTLLLKVLDQSNNVLFNGKLSDFTGFADRRFLKTYSEEPIKFAVKFPDECGNEYQGLAMNVLFTFEAHELPAEWDKSSLEFVEQSRNNNEIYVVIKNVGNQAMVGRAKYEVYWVQSGNAKKEDQLVAVGYIGPLNTNQTQILTYRAEKAGVYMFKAFQRPGHPGKGELWSEAIKIK